MLALSDCLPGIFEVVSKNLLTTWRDRGWGGGGGGEANPVIIKVGINTGKLLHSNGLE